MRGGERGEGVSNRGKREREKESHGGVLASGAVTSVGACN